MARKKAIETANTVIDQMEEDQKNVLTEEG